MLGESTLLLDLGIKMPAIKHLEYSEEVLLRLEGLVPCRESQVSTLLSIFGEVTGLFSIF